MPFEPPFYGHTPTSGMHILKDVWGQVENMIPQIQWLRRELEPALAATRQLAPNRGEIGKGFEILKRIHQGRPENGPERQLEWDLFQQWGVAAAAPLNHIFLQRFVGFQIPIFDNRGRDGWACIDLVGITVNGEPAVFELKEQDARDKPLRLLLEATAYAVALKCTWEAYREELCNVLEQRGVEMNVIQDPQQFHVCLLAPANYWKWLLGNNKITEGHWTEFLGLASELGTHGFPVTFLSINVDHNFEVINIGAQLHH